MNAEFLGRGGCAVHVFDYGDEFADGIHRFWRHGVNIIRTVDIGRVCHDGELRRAEVGGHLLQYILRLCESGEFWCIHTGLLKIIWL